jgi:Flp pilus assembly protein TadG
MRTTRRPAKESRRGQALVEFAILLPLFLLLIFGLIDLGRFVMTDHILSSAAREASRLSAVEASWIGSTDTSCNDPYGPVCPADVATLSTHAEAAANRMVAGLGGTITEIHISCDPPGGQPSGLWTGTSCTSTTSGNVVSVRVVYTYQPITPVIAQLVGSVVRHGAATMVIN